MKVGIIQSFFFAYFLFSFSFLLSINSVFTVDKVSGDDSKGAARQYPFKTIAAALAAASSGDLVWILPGIYDEKLTIPVNVAVQGTAPNQCIIQQVGVTGPTDLITMSNSSKLENVTLILTSAAPAPLHGVVFPGTTSLSAQLRSAVLSINNAGEGPVGSNEVYGVYSNGTAIAAPSSTFYLFPTLRFVGVTINATGSGKIRGLYVDNDNLVNASNCVFNIFGTTGCIGIETTSTGATASILGSAISGDGADISQTRGTINLAYSGLEHSNANGLGFTSRTVPSTILWCNSGSLPAGTNYMRPGTESAASTEIFVRSSQKMLIKAMSVRAGIAPGSGQTDTWTLRKNGVDTALVVSLSDSQTDVVNENLSVHFEKGDSISLKVVRDASSITSDIVVIMDLF